VGDPPEAGTELPVVLFLHGVTALDPRVYQGWIDHIVRRGAFVVYPDYHPANALSVPWSTFLPNLRESVASAETALAGDGSLRPDWSRFAVVGHSLGGVLTTAYAAVAATDGALPVPAALMVVQPGGCRGCGGLTDEGGVPMPDLGTVDPSTRLLVVTADEDEVVGERAARLIWAGLGALPAANKAFVRLRSDRRGQPPLLANHLLAQTGGPGATTDALDWYGTFRLFDLLTACAFADRDCAATLDGPTHELGMGRWSDGTAITPALVGDDPAALAPPGPLVDG
jgi:pimeloyl-ACP methyl ester carboxylesterase